MLKIILRTMRNLQEIESRITPKITANQRRIIESIKTQEELADIVGIVKVNIVKNMRRLQEAGLITRIGADRNGYWKKEESSF